MADTPSPDERILEAENRAAEMEARYDRVTLAMRDLEAGLAARVAALEERAPHPLYIMWPSLPPLTEAQEAELRESAAEALKLGPFTHRVIQQPPPLTPDEVRQLVRECVTVVKPGETLVIRGRDWTPGQVREVQDWMDGDYESGRIDFRVLAVIGDELAVVKPEASDGT